MQSFEQARSQAIRDENARIARIKAELADESLVGRGGGELCMLCQKSEKDTKRLTLILYLEEAKRLARKTQVRHRHSSVRS